MNWVEFWAKISVIEKFIGLSIVILILGTLFIMWLIIRISDWNIDRKRKKKMKGKNKK